MAKHKYIETPEKLYELFERFKTYKKSQKRIIQKATPKGILEEAQTPPLTMSGFRVFAHKEGVTLNHYFANTDNAYEEYRTICRIIEDEIREDQIDGGMVGQYNASITQRLNGLTEKTENVNENKTVASIIFKNPE